MSKNVVQKSEQVKPAGKVALKEPLKRDVKQEDEEYVEQDEEWVDEEFTLDLDIVVENLMDNYLAGYEGLDDYIKPVEKNRNDTKSTS